MLLLTATGPQAKEIIAMGPDSGDKRIQWDANKDYEQSGEDSDDNSTGETRPSKEDCGSGTRDESPQGCSGVPENTKPEYDLSDCCC